MLGAMRLRFRLPQPHRRFVARIIWALVILPVGASAQQVTRQVQSIDWDAAGKARDQDQNRFQTEIKRLRKVVGGQYDNTQLPVLLPKSVVRSLPRFVEQGTSYAATYAIGQDKLSILGSATALSAPESPLAKRQSAQGYVFEKSEDGADLSFSRYGATYTLRLSCHNPASARCTDPAFLTQVANDLVVVGGRGK